jgi:hypothetical protein
MKHGPIIADRQSFAGSLRRGCIRFSSVSARPTPIHCWLLRSSYYLQPLSPFPLFPIEGSLELRTKEGRNFSRLGLEADKLMSSHQDCLAVSIGHWRLGRAATVARTGMYAHQGSDDVHFLAHSGLCGSMM